MKTNHALSLFLIPAFLFLYCCSDSSDPTGTEPQIGTPSNPTPENTSINQPTDITLTWECINTDNRDYKYDLYFGDTPNPSLYLQDIENESATIHNLEIQITYYWKVTCKYEDQRTTGELWSFSTTSDTGAISISSIDQFNVSLVLLDSLIKSVKELSGEIPTTINGLSTILNTRNKNNPLNTIAAQYLFERMNRFNLEVIEQQYSQTGNNIIVVQPAPGVSDYIIFGAHYDSIVMGADDNASGVAVVMEAVRILHNCQPTKNIIYAFWDEEEYAGNGSRYFADSAKTANMNISLAMNIDMIAYDNNNDNVIYVYSTEEQDNDVYLTKLLETNEINEIGLQFMIKYNPESSDDYVFYHEGGFTTLGIGEGGSQWEPDSLNDFNPYWHSDNDKIEHFNMDFFERNAKLAIGTLVEIGFK